MYTYTYQRVYLYVSDTKGDDDDISVLIDHVDDDMTRISVSIDHVICLNNIHWIDITKNVKNIF